MQLERKQPPIRANLKECWVDLDWIIHNLIVFAPVAAAGYREFGRGALIVDMSAGFGNDGYPFSYFTQKELSLHEDEEIDTLITAYDPLEELVIILLEGEQRSRSYRVRTLPDRP